MHPRVAAVLLQDLRRPAPKGYFCGVPSYHYSSSPCKVVILGPHPRYFVGVIFWRARSHKPSQLKNGHNPGWAVCSENSLAARCTTWLRVMMAAVDGVVAGPTRETPGPSPGRGCRPFGPARSFIRARPCGFRPAPAAKHPHRVADTKGKGESRFFVSFIFASSHARPVFSEIYGRPAGAPTGYLAGLAQPTVVGGPAGRLRPHSLGLFQRGASLGGVASDPSPGERGMSSLHVSFCTLLVLC